MKPWLSLAAHEMRDAINFHYPDRDKRSDGWIGNGEFTSMLKSVYDEQQANAEKGTIS